MKTLNTRLIILSLGILLLLSSCVVRSLHAFYTQENIYFENKFIGTWKDSDKAIWEVLSFPEEFLKENKKNKPDELKGSDLELYNKYNNGYLVNYQKKGGETTFLVMPFKINNQLFLDFMIVEIDKPEMNILTWLHLTPTHSLAKFDVLSDNNISIKWFDEDKIKALIEQNKIKIKHEKVGLDNTFLLTASSEELQRFIKKYMASNDEEKWKTDIELELQRIND